MNAATPLAAHVAGARAAVRGMVLAVGDVEQLTPRDGLDMTGPLIAVIAGCLLVAAALLVAVIVLSRPRRTPRAARPGAHMSGGTRAAWLARIETIVERHRAGGLDRQEAFVALADVARAFASEATGDDMSARTLRDLHALPRPVGAAGGLDLLRQTIEALYPPEFADQAVNRRAGEVGVEEAAGWVANLVERWR